MQQSGKLELVSFKVCPFVQRSVIALNYKGVDYTLTHISPHEPPDWFKTISPMGKVPVLLVDGTPVFESAVISEYLDEVYPPALHPADPLRKAQHRAWVEFASELNMRQFRMATAKDETAFNEAHDSLQQGLQRLDSVIAPEAPFFSGKTFHLVDTAYAPFFMRLALVKQHFGLGLGMSERVQAWSDALLEMDAVKTSVVDNFVEIYFGFLDAQNGHILTLKKTA